MAAEQNTYEKKTGRKRARTLEKQLERVESGFVQMYEDSPEMKYLDGEVEWEAEARLIFMIAMRNVNFKWKGLRDYGFIRLCRRWIEGNDLKTMSRAAAESMIRDVLPVGMHSGIIEEMAALDVQ